MKLVERGRHRTTDRVEVRNRVVVYEFLHEVVKFCDSAVKDPFCGGSWTAAHSLAIRIGPSCGHYT